MSRIPIVVLKYRGFPSEFENRSDSNRRIKEENKRKLSIHKLIF